MKRVRTAEVIKAYKKIQFTPGDSLLAGAKIVNCCCALGALIQSQYDEGGCTTTFPSAYIAAKELGLALQYAHGFVIGWDGGPIVKSNKTIVTGFLDGINCHLSVIKHKELYKELE